MARFWRYNRIGSPIRPRHWKLSSRLGLFYFQRKEGCPALGQRPHKKSKRSDVPAIKFIDLFSGAGGFREGLERAGGFACVGHCEIDKRANQSYNALFSTEGEWFCEDIRTADPAGLPDFDLLCGGFPCQSFSLAGKRGGFTDPRGTLFFEIARLVAARHPAYLLLENGEAMPVDVSNAGFISASGSSLSLSKLAAEDTVQLHGSYTGSGYTATLVVTLG